MIDHSRTVAATCIRYGAAPPDMQRCVFAAPGYVGLRLATVTPSQLQRCIPAGLGCSGLTSEAVIPLECSDKSVWIAAKVVDFPLQWWNAAY